MPGQKSHSVQSHSVRVRVPATSANLGAGFDVLGLALNLYNYVSLAAADDGRDRIIVHGEGAALLGDEANIESNIALLAVRRLLRAIDAPIVPLHLTLENGIPLARGLGSSAAARVGALCAANEWAKRGGLGEVSGEGLLSLATELEGHPDNAAAALLGGLVVSAVAEDEAHDEATPNLKRALALRVPVPQFPALAVFVPETELATESARAVLPDAVFRTDATFNISRTGLLLAALTTGQWEILPEALRDKLHQDHRAQLMKAFKSIVRAAREAGAYGATLSGAGPSVLAWLPPGDAALSAEVQRAMRDAAVEHEVFGRALEVGVDLQGCVVAENVT